MANDRLREALARIIDPTSWRDADKYGIDAVIADTIAPSLAKADAIIAFTSPDLSEERAREVLDRACRGLTFGPHNAGTVPYDVAIAAMLAFASPVAGEAPEGWRHVKRGTVYEVIGDAELQMSFDSLVDGSAMRVYRGEDGKLWVREVSEFEDGRFERLAASPAQTQGEG